MQECVDRGVFWHGDLRAILDYLDEMSAAGVDEVVLNASGIAQTQGLNAMTLAIRQVIEGWRTRS